MRKSLLPFVFCLFAIHSAFGQENRHSGPTTLADNERLLNSSKFELGQNSPNPFESVTDIDFSSNVTGFVEFKIVNLIGKEIMRQVMEATPGLNTIKVDGSDFMPGVYVYSLSNGSQTLTRRMVISKK